MHPNNVNNSLQSAQNASEHLEDNNDFETKTLSVTGCVEQQRAPADVLFYALNHSVTSGYSSPRYSYR